MFYEKKIFKRCIGVDRDNICNIYYLYARPNRIVATLFQLQRALWYLIDHYKWESNPHLLPNLYQRAGVEPA